MDVELRSLRIRREVLAARKKVVWYWEIVLQWGKDKR
jgi:hypothetical protein